MNSRTMSERGDQNRQAQDPGLGKADGRVRRYFICVNYQVSLASFQTTQCPCTVSRLVILIPAGLASSEVRRPLWVVEPNGKRLKE